MNDVLYQLFIILALTGGTAPTQASECMASPAESASATEQNATLSAPASASLAIPAAIAHDRLAVTPCAAGSAPLQIRRVSNSSLGPVALQQTAHSVNPSPPRSADSRMQPDRSLLTTPADPDSWALLLCGLLTGAFIAIRRLSN